jgi:hypothetical protein
MLARGSPRTPAERGANGTELARWNGVDPRPAPRNKKPGGPSGSPGVQCVLCCTDSGPKVVVRGGGSGCPDRPQLPEQPRVPQEFHLTVAAHSSSHVQSQSVTDHLRFGRANSVDNGSWPCPAVTGNFEGDCRTRLGGNVRCHRDAGLSMSFYCPPPDSTSRQRLAGNGAVRADLLPPGRTAML